MTGYTHRDETSDVWPTDMARWSVRSPYAFIAKMEGFGKVEIREVLKLAHAPYYGRMHEEDDTPEGSRRSTFKNVITTGIIIIIECKSNVWGLLSVAF